MTFGQLESVPLRMGWPHEAKDFTPWLSTNLDQLGKALGLGLELRAVEHPVGRYSLDILAVDVRGRVVAIENQFGSTDHDHLGKLLTYVAGTQATVVVWIAEAIGAEHLAVLEWLNQHTPAEIAVFGVELELLRIGDSPLAPNFRVVARPNELTKQTRIAATSQVAWSWDTYASHLNISQERLQIAEQLVDAISNQVGSLELGWQPVFNKGFVVFKRSGGYKVLLVDVYWNGPVRLAVTVPGDLDQLGIEDPYPDLERRWTKAERELGWTIRSIDQIPDVGAAVQIARRYAPSSGPMPAIPAAD